MVNKNLLEMAERWMNKEVPQRKPANNSSRVQPERRNFGNIEDILQGKIFSSDKKKGDEKIGIAVALQKTLDYAGSDGYVATMPELIATQAKGCREGNFWKESYYDVHTEEDIGIDKKGKFYSKGEPVLVIVNGGGILDPDRIMRAYDEGLIEGSARYDPKEFDDILDGKLPDGSSIELYNFKEIKRGVSNLPHKFGIVMPYSIAQATKSKDYGEKREFMENPLIIARAGGLKYLDDYFREAISRRCNLDGGVENWHHFEDRDASIPQGCLLGFYNRAPFTFPYAPPEPGLRSNELNTLVVLLGGGEDQNEI